MTQIIEEQIEQIYGEYPLLLRAMEMAKLGWELSTDNKYFPQQLTHNLFHVGFVKYADKPVVEQAPVVEKVALEDKPEALELAEKIGVDIATQVNAAEVPEVPVKPTRGRKAAQ